MLSNNLVIGSVWDSKELLEARAAHHGKHVYNNQGHYRVKYCDRKNGLLLNCFSDLNGELKIEIAHLLFKQNIEMISHLLLNLLYFQKLN